MIYLKRMSRWLLWVLCAHLVYLAIVMIWANNAYETLHRSYKVVSTQLSPEFERILLQVEDPRFYQHSGLDLSSGQGVTTLTSSLARDFFLYGQELQGVSGLIQGFYRRVFECCKKIDIGRDVMALILNVKMPKSEQLNAYVMWLYMGQANEKAVVGLATASQQYFNQPLDQLARADFIRLVAMIKGPNLYHPHKNAGLLDERANKITHLLDGQCQAQGWFDTDYPDCVEVSH